MSDTADSSHSRESLPRGMMMIKIISTLVFLQGALGGPGSPFLRYGLPAESNIDANTLPFDQGQEQNAPELLPGTRNLLERSQVPEFLPGTRNLDEKSIPTPGGGYESNSPQGYAENGPKYSLAQPEGSQELPKPSQPGAPFAGYQPAVEGFGSEIKDTQISPGSQSPSVIPAYGLPAPSPSSAGEDIRDTSIPSASLPASNFPSQNALNIPPASSVSVQDAQGQYSHGFSSPDGTQVQESGHLISTDDGWEYVIAKEGSYSYLSPEGIPIRTTYIADDKGYRVLSQSFAGR